MPVMNGVEAVRELVRRGLKHDTLVLGCTGNTLAEDQVEFRAAGVDAVCAKPVCMKDLVALVLASRGLE
jgi:CheY-like chemotaxis protein